LTAADLRPAGEAQVQPRADDGDAERHGKQPHVGRTVGRRDGSAHAVSGAVGKPYLQTTISGRTISGAARTRHHRDRLITRSHAASGIRVRPWPNAIAISIAS